MDYYESPTAPDDAIIEGEDYEEEFDEEEDLIADAHHRINAVISVLLKKGLVTEEELEAEGALLEAEDDVDEDESDDDSDDEDEEDR